MATRDDGRSSGWALVLGASSGFGRAVATRLAAEGYDICGVHLDRRATMPAVEQLERDLRATGRQALLFNVNAADDEKRVDVVERLCAVVPKAGLRLLFHSLAFGSLAPLVAENERASARRSQVEMTLDVMASSLVYWTQALVWQGLLAGGSRVIAMTSAGSHRVTAGYGMVSAAKAALEAYVRQLAFELAPLGISVNAVRAGVTDTPALRKIPGWEDIKARAARVNPGGRATHTDDVADVVSLLVRPESRWMTGNVLGVDGGEDIVG
jgi:NAD(P)-dependent dehydrogenase (short-subunit alcohol dehydrogenase family)